MTPNPVAQPAIVPTAVVGRAIEIFRAHAAVLFPVALIFALIQAMVTIALADTSAAAIALGVSLVTSVFFQGMVVTFVRDVEAGLPPGTEPSVGTLFRSVSPVAGPLLLVSLLAGLGIGVGFVLLIVPGLILLTIWAVVAPVVVLERTGVLASFGRSQELVRGSGWPVFGTLVLMVLLLIATAIVGGLAIAGIGEAAGNFVQVLISAVTSTIYVLTTATLYFRLREAREAGPAEPVATVPDDDPRWTQQD
ncbi:hypothetical protein [Patulibacter sp.]|uniref:hypothetical protein n=1 Tax=Patulibacter sp. TaxID=1912859 RepID=UPI00271D31EC|nr:hypothetical protein [Patulibacter sp.]MDO9407326.1 hypothetical protein [Patulibacter sp.]